ncbi:MAG: hypothetical protein WCL44_11270 [bacterium]
MKKLILLMSLYMAGTTVNAESLNAFVIPDGMGTAPVAAGDFLFDSRSHIRLGKGDVTWTAAASMFAPAGSSVDGQKKDSSSTAYASLSYFLVDTYELEGSTFYMKGTGLEGVALGAGVNMYFREFFDKWYPYAGLALSKWYSDLAEQGTHYQAKVGARYFFTDSLGLRIWAEYDWGDNFIYNCTEMFTAYVGVFSMAY